MSPLTSPITKKMHRSVTAVMTSSQEGGSEKEWSITRRRVEGHSEKKETRDTCASSSSAISRASGMAPVIAGSTDSCHIGGHHIGRDSLEQRVFDGDTCPILWKGGSKKIMVNKAGTPTIPSLQIPNTRRWTHRCHL